MFGTVAVMRAKPGQEKALVDSFQEWWNERRPKVKGALASTLYRGTEGPNQYFMAVVFDSKENYDANANDPAQDQWYQKLVGMLEEEPHWYDGDILLHLTA